MPSFGRNVIAHYDINDHGRPLDYLPRGKPCNHLVSIIATPMTTQYEESTFGTFAVERKRGVKGQEYSHDSIFLQPEDAVGPPYKYLVSFAGSVHNFAKVGAKWQFLRLRLFEKHAKVPAGSLIRASMIGELDQNISDKIITRECKDDLQHGAATGSVSYIDSGPCIGSLDVQTLFNALQTTKFHLCLGGDVPNADRFIHVFYWGGLCIVVIDPDDPVYEHVGFSNIVPYHKFWISIPLQHFKANPWGSIVQAINNISDVEYTRRRSLQQEYKRDVLFNVPGSRVAENYLIAARASAREALEECMSTA